MVPWDDRIATGIINPNIRDQASENPICKSFRFRHVCIMIVNPPVGGEGQPLDLLEYGSFIQVSAAVE